MNITNVALAACIVTCAGCTSMQINRQSPIDMAVTLRGIHTDTFSGTVSKAYTVEDRSDAWVNSIKLKFAVWSYKVPQIVDTLRDYCVGRGGLLKFLPAGADNSLRYESENVTVGNCRVGKHSDHVVLIGQHTGEAYMLSLMVIEPKIELSKDQFDLVANDEAGF